MTDIIETKQPLIYGQTPWEASKGMMNRTPKVVAREFTPELLKTLKKHIPRYKPDKYFVPNETSVCTDIKPGRKPTVVCNRDLVDYFNHSDYYSYKDSSCEELLLWEQFDNILHGVARLDLGGNERPLGKVTLYKLLSTLDELTKEAMMDAVGVKDRQARRYLSACIIAQTMIRKEIEVNNLQSMSGSTDNELSESDKLVIERWERELENDE